MNPVAASVFRWYGDSRFCKLSKAANLFRRHLQCSTHADKTPGLKAALVGVSACSIFYRLLAARASPRVSP